MSRVWTLFRSAVFLKAVMAVTGVVLFGFVLAHMSGNLKVFQGPEKINEYAEFLREVGQPVLPRTGLLWILRVGLVAAVGLHIWSAVVLTLENRRARPKGYALRKPIQLDYASRTMRWSGFIVAGYVIYHLLHFTGGQAHADFVAGDVYHNLVSAFQNPLVAGVYIVVNVLLGLHLYHGLWSLFQTLGLNHPLATAVRRPLAAAFAVVVTLGFIAVPVSILTGVVS